MIYPNFTGAFGRVAAFQPESRLGRTVPFSLTSFAQEGWNIMKTLKSKSRHPSSTSGGRCPFRSLRSLKRAELYKDSELRQGRRFKWVSSRQSLVSGVCWLFRSHNNNQMSFLEGMEFTVIG